MALADKFTCDVCGKEKLSTNHWWCGYVSTAVGYMLTPFCETLARNDIVQSFCGQQCVTKAVSQWMAEQSKS
jgi:hypothetical protein